LVTAKTARTIWRAGPAVIVAILLIQVAGIWWHIATSDQAAHETGLLIVLVATIILATILYIAEYVGNRNLSGSARLANDWLQLAMESGKTVAWDWDLKTGRDVWFGDLKTLFGLSTSIYEGKVEDFRNRVHPDDRELVWRAVAQARQDRSIYRAVFRVVWPDGTIRRASATGKFDYAANGNPVRMLGVAVDITEIYEVEEKLREYQEQLKGIVEAAMDAIIAVDDEQRVRVFNAAAERMFGCRASDAIGAPLEQFVPERFRAAHREHVRKLGETRTPLRPGGPGRLWGLRSDGSEFPIETSISVVDVGARKLFTVILRDVTERKRTDDLLRESEQRFRLMADTAPVMLWMSDADKRCHYINRAWLEFTGRAPEAELGNGWLELVHPDDLNSLIDNYVQAFDRRESYQTEFRLLRHDGEYRWVLATGAPRLLPDGTYAGYIGSAVDVTEHKLATTIRSGLSRKLMEAQEKERAWIARELHDDVVQRMALLTIELDRLGQGLPRQSGELRIRINELSGRVTELSKDIQAISHRLHSSKLEYLGIAAAAGAFCRELSEQQSGVTIAFTEEGVRPDVPKDVALALFRVLQEALTNAVKHAGVSHVNVALRGCEDAIELEVVDTGIGFDPAAALRAHGLGLVSMQERLNLVHGEFAIDSRPGAGTKVCARVPLAADEVAVAGLDEVSAT
jgi:PAS domain S-box-containing protein